jgi:hypothetical protein
MTSLVDQPNPGSPIPSRNTDQEARSSLTIAGSDGSFLKLTHDGLLVCPSSPFTSSELRFWAYRDLCDIRLSAYGPIGVIRVTLRRTEAELPLLVLEPNQIGPARRTLEIVWNRIANEGRPAA